MDEPIEVLYFNWLYSLVSDFDERSPRLRYTKLLGLLHSLDFIFVISGDDNRAQDAKDLRVEFIHEEFYPDAELAPKDTPSVLEALIAFSRTASFETDETARAWFWVMLSNLGLSDMNDSTSLDEAYICSVVETFVWRRYDAFGNGGLFPMPHTQNDQREVEIWYQFNEYLVEIDYD